MRGLLRSFMLPVKEINDSIPNTGLIYEIGSGIGTLAKALAQFSATRRVIGLDYDRHKINSAKKSYPQKNVDYIHADALRFPYKQCQGVVMSDFLHHISYSHQEEILEIITKKVKKQGKIVIKEIVRDDGVFMWLSRLWDFLLYPKDKICYRTRNEWIKLFTAFGYNVKVKRAAHWFPGSTHLFICQKK